MNPFSSWFCSTNSSKNLFVKIVHHGGQVELHDRPILASELLTRNPKCCVTHHTVFQEPYAIVSPNTTLALGKKYYVVPLGTIWKLQQKYSPSLLQESDHKRNSWRTDRDRRNKKDSTCWSMRNNSKNAQKAKNGKNGSSIDNWQPGLESITEE